jgi:peptidoglycan-associated lipoprotein
MKIIVEGHCDERGTIEYNLALGQKRAETVKNYLVNTGINEARIKTISFGKELPADSGHGEDAWTKNRRASFKID